MPDLLCILNHNLTEMQKTDAKIKMNIDKIIEPPESINDLWANVSPEGELNIDKLQIVINWIKGKSAKNDYVLVQGEFGATFYIIDFCFKYGLIPIYATSERKYKEIVLSDNSIERRHIFQHVQFRKYKYWEIKP